MANHKSSLKRIRQTATRKAHNHYYARVQVIEDCKSKTLINIIENNVENGSSITTDELGVYCAIDRSKKQYNHAVVCHKDKEFTNKAGFTTNRIEGFWGGFKRMV